MKRKRFKKLNSLNSRIEATSIFGGQISVIILLLIVSALLYKVYEIMSMVLLGVAIIGIVGRVWTRIVSKKVSVVIDTKKAYMFPGDKSNLQFKIRNEKAMPVSYVEIEKEFDKPLIFDIENAELETLENGKELYNVRCSLIKGNQVSTCASEISALRRGVENLLDIEFTTGDPFGICCAKLNSESQSKKEIVVYPSIIPVDVSKFTKDLWDGEHSNRGVLEDISVIKLTRPYENNDSEKQINWRLLARGQGLITNQYEVISPKRIHIIFDGQSFNGITKNDEILVMPRENALEDTLSILASMTLSLEQQGIFVGYSFPKTKRLNPVNIKGEASTSMEVLYRMAEFSLFDLQIIVESYVNSVKKYYPVSDFDVEEIIEQSNQYGKLYFVTYDTNSAADSATLKRLADEGISVSTITYNDLRLLKQVDHTKAGGAVNE